MKWVGFKFGKLKENKNFEIQNKQSIEIKKQTLPAHITKLTQKHFNF